MLKLVLNKSFLLPAGGGIFITEYLALRCVQTRTHIKQVKFGADRTLHV